MWVSWAHQKMLSSPSFVDFDHFENLRLHSVVCSFFPHFSLILAALQLCGCLYGFWWNLKFPPYSSFSSDEFGYRLLLNSHWVHKLLNKNNNLSIRRLDHAMPDVAFSFNMWFLSNRTVVAFLWLLFFFRL